MQNTGSRNSRPYSKTYTDINRMKNYINFFLSIFCQILIILSTVVNAHGQDYLSSSQYMNNLTPINAAYSLLANNGSITSSLKKQWNNLPGSPTTWTFNAQLPLESINGSTGLFLMDSQLAIEHLTEVNAFFAKSAQLSQNLHLGVAINAGIRKYVANYSSLDNSNDPLFINDVRQTQPNVGFSVILYNNSFYLGVSMPQFSIKSLGTASIDDINYFKNRYTVSAACLLEISKGIEFKPAGLFTYINGTPVIYQVSGTFYFNRQVGLGLDVRSNNKAASILSLGMDNFRIGYSYQFGLATNNLNVSNFSNHEISISYYFGRHMSEHSIL